MANCEEYVPFLVLLAQGHSVWCVNLYQGGAASGQFLLKGKCPFWDLLVQRSLLKELWVLSRPCLQLRKGTQKLWGSLVMAERIPGRRLRDQAFG